MRWWSLISGLKPTKKAFVTAIFRRCLKKGQKLPNALILESHLQEIIDNDMPKKLKGKPDKKQLEVIKKRLDSCYVCDRIEWDMHHFCDTIFVEWAKGVEFYKLYNEQPFICFKHYDFIMNVATQKSKLPSKLLPQFYAETAGLTKKYLLSLKEDITYFCSMFDYRNHGKDWGNSKGFNWEKYWIFDRWKAVNGEPNFYVRVDSLWISKKHIMPERKV